MLIVEDNPACLEVLTTILGPDFATKSTEELCLFVASQVGYVGRFLASMGGCAVMFDGMMRKAGLDLSEILKGAPKSGQNSEGLCGDVSIGPGGG